MTSCPEPVFADRDGFGGHTPLSNAVVSGPWKDDGMARALLERRATKITRASLRKFLDWIETPHWHEARHNYSRVGPRIPWGKLGQRRSLTASRLGVGERGSIEATT